MVSSINRWSAMSMLIIMSKRKEEYEILKWHPEILLISRFPFTFEGFLTVTVNCSSDAKNFIKSKLIVPMFPSLERMAICVTKNFEIISADILKIILNLLRKETSLHSFLKQLKGSLTLQAENEFTSDVSKSDPMSLMYESMINRLWEVKDLLHKSLEIQILSNQNFNIIKLTSNGVSAIVQNDEGNLWKIVYSEIPSISEHKFTEFTTLPLSHVCKFFITKLKVLKRIWAQLKEIDTHCWVMDPVHPKPYHLYRRIYLTQSLSIMITVDPCYGLGVPNIKFVGCESTISEYREKVFERVQKWDSALTLLQNISLLLNINEFPQTPELKNAEIEEGIVNDNECSICFLKELDDGHLPNTICQNTRCRKQYHLGCLKWWLETINRNSAVFDKLLGECLHCGEKISCVL